MKLQTMKLWEVRARRQIIYHRLINMDPNDFVIDSYIIASDEKLANDIIRKNGRHFELVLLEEMEPSTSNMIGVLYARYLKIKDIELKPYGSGDSVPRYFESVLKYSNDLHLTSTWNKHFYKKKERITLKDHINENRDRAVIMETIKNRLEIRKKLLLKESEDIVTLENSLKNLEILPIND